ncbi:MAG TPA: TfoX/Sxy family protein [Stellaceae bacterium]|nr:TfoX/Sxy family protein [Stellaceae bacterium]
MNPTHDGLVAHVLDMLEDWGGVSARRMFSGYGVFRQGAMFGLIARDTFYLRVDDRTRADFAAAGSRVFTYRREAREVELRGYMECPPDILEDAEEMIRWAKAAASAALAALEEKPATKRRSAKSARVKTSR